MLIASIMAVVACLAVSFLSKSALKWSVLMALGMAISFTVATMGQYSMIWVVDLAMMLAMIGMRQEINREWQDGVIRLQGVVTTIYMVFAVFSESQPWLISPLIDAGNLLCLVQLALVGFGGAMNSRRNFEYVRQLRKSGSKSPWLLTAWRMI